MTFREYLRNLKKKNRDGLMPSTIEVYCGVIDKYKEFITNSLKETIINFNNIIIKTNDSIVSSAFNHYLRYRGCEIKDDHIKYKGSKFPYLKKPKNISMMSIRFLQEKILSYSEIKLLIFSKKKLREGFFYSAIYDMGCRREEVVGGVEKDGFKHKGIRDLDVDILRIPEGGIYAKINILGKGGKKRMVYWTKTTLMLYLKYKDKHDIKPIDNIFYLKQKNGKDYKNPGHELYKIMIKHSKETIDREVHPHMFRHTKGTHMANNGVDVLKIMAYLGHVDIKTTMIYVKISSFLGKLGWNQGTKDLSEM